MNPRRPLRFFTILAALFLVGCVSNVPPQREIPRFANKLPAPLAIRVLDLRPDIQRNPGVSPEWIYLTTRSEEVPLVFARYAGNALNSFRAIPGYRLVEDTSPNHKSDFLLHVEIQNGYARWPMRRTGDSEKIAVEGQFEVRYRLYKQGELFHRGHVKYTPPPFTVPVSLVRQDNVDKIVGESLTFQLDKSITGVLDILLMELTRRWEKFGAE